MNVEVNGQNALHHRATAVSTPGYMPSEMQDSCF